MPAEFFFKRGPLKILGWHNKFWEVAAAPSLGATIHPFSSAPWATWPHHYSFLQEMKMVWFLKTEILLRQKHSSRSEISEGLTIWRVKKNQFTVMKQRACQLNNMTTLVVFLNSFWTVKDLLRGGSCMALASVVVQSFFFFSGDLLTGVIKTNASSVLLVHALVAVPTGEQLTENESAAVCLQSACNRTPNGPKCRNVAQVSHDYLP